jgi:hypothetical protein
LGIEAPEEGPPGGAIATHCIGAHIV